MILLARDGLTGIADRLVGRLVGRRQRWAPVPKSVVPAPDPSRVT
jgi:hypothetical protein